MAAPLLMRLFGATLYSTGVKAKQIATNPGAFFGSAGVMQRVGLTAAYMGTAGIFNAVVSNFEERQRNYYGQERYESYYGSGADTLRFGSIALGGLLSFQALTGRDPISRIALEGRYQAARVKTFFNKRSLSKLEKSQDELSRITKKLEDPNAFKPNPDEYLDDIQYKQAEKKLLTKKKETLENLLPKTKKEIGRLREAIEAGEKNIAKLKPQPGLTPFYLARATAFGLTVSGITTSGGLFSKGALTAAGLGAGIIVGRGAQKLGSAITKAGGWPATAMVAATSYGVYSSTSSITRNMTAEGTITDVSMANQSEGVSKMNFSTAGLVLALHNSNRKY